MAPLRIGMVAATLIALLACEQKTEEPPPSRLGPTSGSGAGGAGGGTGGSTSSGAGGDDCSNAGDGSFATTSADVSFNGADGVTIFGTVFSPDQDGAYATIVLLHQLCQDRSEWTSLTNLAPDLAAAGFTVFAYDARGHGESNDGGSLDLCNSTNNLDFAPMVVDLGLALNFLDAEPKANLDCIGVAGGSIGANVSLSSAADMDMEWNVKTVVLLSPGISYFGIGTEGPIQDFHPRASLLYASDGDSPAASTVNTLAGLSDAATPRIWSGPEHGASILATHADAKAEVMAWFADRL